MESNGKFIGPFFYIRGKLIYMPVLFLKEENRQENWITLMVMTNYMMTISNSVITLIILVEGLYGTRKRITRLFTLTHV